MKEDITPAEQKDTILFKSNKDACIKEKERCKQVPGISFLDNNTSYAFAKFLDVFIKAGSPIFSIISVGVIFADFKSWKPQRIWTKLTKWTIHFLLFGLVLFCIMYNIDGRYTETEVGDHGYTDYYYFGKAKNNVRFGFGKLFDNNQNIYMISDAKGNSTYENVRQYHMESDCIYLSFEGSIVNGKEEGAGKQYIFVNGESFISYEGMYHLGLKTEHGIEYKYYLSDGTICQKYVGDQLAGEYNGYGEKWTFDEDGNLTSYYAGGWAEGEKWGYGVDLDFQDDKVSQAYRGLYWNGQCWGKGILEYVTDNGALITWVGNSSEGLQSDDGAYYDSDGAFWAAESNGSLVEREDGTWIVDDNKKEQLMSKWPLPDILMLGMSAEEFLSPGAKG